MRTFMAIGALVALALTTPASAEKVLIHHIDLVHVGIDGGVKVHDIGYHFTTFRLGKRFQFLGPAAGLDTWETDNNGSMSGSLYVGANLFSWALTDPTKWKYPGSGNTLVEEFGYISVGANYLYRLGPRDRRISVGFSFSIK